MLHFRLLRADEIDCRVAMVRKNGCSLLLYKDARVDQNILDETFGVFGWQRSHQMIGDNLYCTVSVKNPETGEWISKQDVGTESNTEKEKGQASDSFKRACFNLGIGRELYTAPFIWIPSDRCNITDNNGKPTTYDRFRVSKIGYEDGKITQLVILNDKSGNVVYSLATQEPPKNTATKEKTASMSDRINAHMVKTLETMANNHKMPETVITARYGVKSLDELTMSNWRDWTQYGKDVLDNWDETHGENNG